MERLYSKPAVIVAVLYLILVVLIEWYLLSCSHGGWLDLCGIERYLVVPELIILPVEANPVNLDSLFSAETYNYGDYYIYGPDVLITYLVTIGINTAIIYLIVNFFHKLISKRK